MIIREIPVGGLIDFIHSEEYLKLEPKPITPLRAVSQARNPAALAEDIALVFIAENNKLLAFAGNLPDEIHGVSERTSSNSGWWVHAELGRKYGLTVFFKAFQSCNRRMFFTDCSEHTKRILESTGLFTFQKPKAGLRIIMQFYSGNLIRRKGYNRFISRIFSAADAFLNSLVAFRIEGWRKKNLPQGYSIQSVESIGEELNDFIKQHSSNYFLKQGGEKLNWIIKNPWIETNEKVRLVDYPFTQVADDFKQEFLVVRKDGETVAVLFLSLRENHASVPYIYYKNNHLQQILKVFVNYLFKSKVSSLVVFQQEVLKMLNKIGFPSIFKLKVIRYFGYAKELDEAFSAEKHFQDGEGDVAFT